MDSHSRSASPREPSRPQHRPPSPPASPAGFDNRAYQHDEADPNHNDSFASNQPHQNGHTKEPNGDTKTLEAVNLELINLTPKNGNAKKKDVEVDMNATNPYDEYFVPVNEHRKYMRGEKLYVTADKRGEKGGCKRPLCWTLLGLVVAAIVAIIVLAATGILFTNSPTPLEPYNTSVSSARALGGIGGHVHNNDHDHNHDHDHHDHDHEHHDHTTQLPTTQHVPETQNDEGNDHSVVSEESGDMSMYVPKTVEGELRIDNKDFVSALEDPESDEYKEFTSSFSDALKRALFDRNTIDNGDNEITVDVVRIKEGSVIVTYRIHWKPRFNVESTEDLLTANSLKSSLDQYLDRNNRMISIYHVAEDKISTRPVLDLCQINNNDCEYGCIFDDATLDFTCTCPHGQIQDMRSPKRCISVLDQEEKKDDNTDKEFKVLTLEDGTETMKAMPGEEKPDTQTVHMANDETAFDWKGAHHLTPEQTTESDSDVNFSHIFGHPRSKNNDIEAETTNPVPESTVEPKSEPEPTAEPKPAEDIEVKPEPAPTAEPSAEPEPAAEPKPEPEPAAEPAVEPNPTAEPNNEPSAESEPASHTEPSAESEPASEPEPSSEPEPRPQMEPSVEPEPESEPEPTSEPEPASEPEPTSSETKPENDLKPETELEPTAEPKPEIQTIVASKPDSESSGEFKPESENNTEFEPHLTSQNDFKVEMDSRPIFQSNIKETNVIGQTVIREETSTRATELEEEIKPETDRSTIKDNNITITSIESQPKTESSLDVETEPEITKLTNMDKSGSKIEDNDQLDDIKMTSETTTTRISISEPNIINEPSYEPKPEIISILSEDKERTETHFKSTDDDDDYLSNDTHFNSTDDEDDYLSNDNEDSSKYNRNVYQVPSDMNSQILQDSVTATEVNNSVSRDETGSEQRSSKNLDTELNFDTTTNKDILNSNDDVTFELVAKASETPVESTTKTTEHIPETTTAMNEKIFAQTESDIAATTVLTDTIVKSDSSPMEAHENTNVFAVQSNEDQNQPTTSEMPIMGVQTANEYSINKEYQESADETHLMNALENKNVTEITLNNKTEHELHDENDVTFDAINMLYNRSSKSIDNTDLEQATESTNTNDSIDSTDSDWLSETVTEENYNEAISKMTTQESTETPISQIDEVINSGSNKDDFEPDYLSNIGSNNSDSTENDEPMYGIIQDYNTDDLRVKKSEKPEINTTDSSKDMNEPKIFDSSFNTPIETTTVTTITQYIYKTSENFENTSLTNNGHQYDVKENNKDETSHASNSEGEIGRANITDDSLIIPTTLTATAMGSLGKDSITESPDTYNTTKVSNLNVMIYEISNHSGNSSLSTPNHTHPQSAEYEDHETEMNPFLPEAENNKVLVKKLQEGHDLDLVNLNETQNENAEEHLHTSTHDNFQANNIKNGNQTRINKELSDTSTMTGVPVTTTTESALLNELLMSSNSQSSEDDSLVTTLEPQHSSPIVKQTPQVNKHSSVEVLPISTFLLDTDDLDIKRQLSDEENNFKPETMNSPTEAEVTSTPKNETEDDDSEYLSVVPIEPEKLEDKEALKSYNSENIQALNDISDSPKKSDRRTLDTTNLESVINNEA